LSTNGINVYYLYADIAPTATVSGTLTKVTLNCSDPLIAKAADVNKDCRVNFADFAELAKEWLNCYDQMNCQ
jgi:hypothetical protein